jgi:hypothetical protein
VRDAASRAADRSGHTRTGLRPDPIFDQAVAGCSPVRTLEFLLSLSGQSGDTRLRGRVRVALAEPASARLEALAPFGQPLFYLVSTSDGTTLFLTREGRVVREGSAADVLEALIGVRLDADDLRAVLTGCLVPNPRPLAARRYEGDWLAVDLDGGSIAYLRTTTEGPRLVAGVRGDLRVEYGAYERGVPRQIRVTTAQRRADGDPVTHLIADVSQVSLNIDLSPEVFALRVPDGVLPMSLDELRASGPLREVSP